MHYSMSKWMEEFGAMYHCVGEWRCLEVCGLCPIKAFIQIQWNSKEHLRNDTLNSWCFLGVGGLYMLPVTWGCMLKYILSLRNWCSAWQLLLIWNHTLSKFNFLLVSTRVFCLCIYFYFSIFHFSCSSVNFFGMNICWLATGEYLQ